MDQKKVLVVEDDVDIMTILQAQLKLDKYEVRGAESGKDGLDLFDAWHPDIMILDLNLPDIDGLDVCRGVRKESDIPIVVLSARDSMSDKLRGFHFGVDDYITKPFEYMELRARIEACLRRGHAWNPQKNINYGKIKVFPQKRQVMVDDRTIDLTNKEFDLLELLLAHMGKVLSREFLYNHLWPSPKMSSRNRALDVQIRRLRQKIEPNPDRPIFIITHPGVGYRFEKM